MRRYPVHVIADAAGGVIGRFPDVPEAVACGASEQEVLENARPVLEAVLEAYLFEGRPLPEPSDPGDAPVVATDRFEPGRWRPFRFPGPL